MNPQRAVHGSAVAGRRRSRLSPRARRALLAMGLTLLWYAPGATVGVLAELIRTQGGFYALRYRRKDVRGIYDVNLHLIHRQQLQILHIVDSWILSPPPS